LRGGGWRTEVRRYESKGKQLQRLPGPMKLDRPLQNQTQSQRRPAEAGRYNVNTTASSVFSPGSGR